MTLLDMNAKETPVTPITVEEEFKKNPDLKPAQIALLREWADKQPHLPLMEDRELVLFLHSCYYRTEAAKTTADVYFTARSQLPEFFADRDIRRADVALAAQVTLMTTLPQPTPEGHKVVYCRVLDSDASKFVHVDAIKVFFMVVDLWLLAEGTAPGHVMIIDMEKIVLAHLGRLSIVAFKKFFYYLQEALPFRLKGLHFINAVPFMDKVMAMMKPFMKKEVQEVFHIYTAEQIEGLYKFVPQDVLPKEYGGKGPAIEELHKRTHPHLEVNRPWFEAEEKRTVDESKRSGRSQNAGDLFGVEGSFKKLDID